MAMLYKKDNALCSPTSALGKKRMLNRLGEELRNSESFLTDSDKFIVETLGSHVAVQFAPRKLREQRCSPTRSQISGFKLTPNKLAAVDAHRRPEAPSIFRTI